MRGGRKQKKIIKLVLLGLCIRGKRQEQENPFESPYKKLEKQKTTKFVEIMYVFAIKFLLVSALADAGRPSIFV